MNSLRLILPIFLSTIWFSVTTSYESVAQSTPASESETPAEEYEDLDELPFYISFGPNYNQFSGREYPVKFGYKAFVEGGLLIQAALFQEYPFYTGLEYQRRGYDIDQLKKGTLQNGKAYEDRSKGTVRIDYLNIPLLFKIPKGKVNQRFHLLTGPGISLRIHYFEQFEASRTIPADTLVITVPPYSETGNDALDFLDFNYSLGARYYLGYRFEVWAMATRKLFGMSLGKQNFITSKEINTNFTLKLVYKLPSLFGPRY